MKKNQIEIDIDSIEDINARNFVLSEIKHCNKNKIQVKLLNGQVNHNNVECSGLFEDEPDPCLSVNCAKNLEDWLIIFVHESCHKDQFLEKTPEWTNKIGSLYDPLDIFDMWVDGHIELKKKQLKPVLKYITEIELDCEKRSVEKIKMNNLPINLQDYIQKSNAYVWYYHAVSKYRSYTKKQSPYSNSNIWTKMPVDFDCNYSKINSKMLKLFTKYCY